MTFWEFSACIDGWNRSQGTGHHHNGEPLTDDEYDELVALGEMWSGTS